MFRISYVHHQEDYIVHAALYVLFSMHLCKHFGRLNDVLDTVLSFSEYRVWRIEQCFSTFVRPRLGKFFFHKTRARSQQIYS